MAVRSPFFHIPLKRWGVVEYEPEEVSITAKSSPFRSIGYRYFATNQILASRIPESYKLNWFIVYRDITNVTNERTTVASLIPRKGIAYTLRVILKIQGSSCEAACFLTNLNSLAFDYISRQSVGGIHLSDHIFKQLPVLPSSSYRFEDFLFIVPSALELVYTAWDIKSFADDVWRDADEELRAAIRRQWEENRSATGGHEWKPPEWAEIAEDGIPLPPFKWDENRRAILRAELDAYYAKLYGLTRKQLRYILDPVDLTEKELEDILDPWEEVKDPLAPESYAKRVEKSTFPGETFRVLKEKEIRQFGEYRTRRLILEAWDRLEVK